MSQVTDIVHGACAPEHRAHKPISASLGAVSGALAQDLITSFDLDAAAQLSRTNRVWRQATLNDPRLRYDVANTSALRPTPAQGSWRRRDHNAAAWHERVCQAIDADAPHYLALLLTIGTQADPHFIGVLTGTSGHPPSDVNYLMRAAQVPATKCAKVLINHMPTSAVATDLRGWRASRYAEHLGYTSLWRMLRVTELATGEPLQPWPMPAQPPIPTGDAWPITQLLAGDYRAMVLWLERQRHARLTCVPPDLAWVGDLERVLMHMPVTESLQAKWAMRQLAGFYKHVMPAPQAWSQSIKALFAQQPKLRTSPCINAYAPALDAETQAALDEVIYNYPVPQCASPSAGMALVDSLFVSFASDHFAARVALLARLCNLFDVRADAIAVGHTHSFAQRAYKQQAMSFIVATVRQQQHAPGRLTPDRNFLHCMPAEIRSLYRNSAMRFEAGIQKTIDLVFPTEVALVLGRLPQLLLERDASHKTPTQVILNCSEHLYAGIEMLTPIELMYRLLVHFPRANLAQSLSDETGRISPDTSSAIDAILESIWMKQPRYSALAAFLIEQDRPSESYKQKLFRNVWHVIGPQD